MKSIQPRAGKRQLSVYLPSEEYALVQRETVRRDVTMQQVLSEALRPFINELRNREARKGEE